MQLLSPTSHAYTSGAYWDMWPVSKQLCLYTSHSYSSKDYQVSEPVNEIQHFNPGSQLTQSNRLPGIDWSTVVTSLIQERCPCPCNQNKVVMSSPFLRACMDSWQTEHQPYLSKQTCINDLINIHMESKYPSHVLKMSALLLVPI